METTHISTEILDNQEQQDSPVTVGLRDKIRIFLGSDDIEMAQLGALLLQTHIKQSEWEGFLTCLNPKYRYAITTLASSGEITILLRKYQGVYEQLNNGNKYTYNPAVFSLNTLQEAIEQLNNKYEHKQRQGD